MSGFHPYRSNYELTIAKWLERNDIEFRYENETIRYFAKVTNGVCPHCCSREVYQDKKYIPDFFLGPYYVEAKGKFTSDNRTKMLEVRESNPKLDIRLLFMYDNWLTRKKKQRYSDWCNRNKFKWAIGPTLPQEWINEISST
jgi:hypothetical protein